MATSLKLTRNQLASFLKDQEQIKQFERLILLVNDYLNSGSVAAIDDTIGNAISTASSAFSLAIENSARIDGLEQSPRNELGTMAALQQANIPWVTFDTAPEVIPTNVGSLYWDGGTTLGVQMTFNVLGRVNEDLFYYIKATGAITKGQVVMFTGAVGASGVATGAPASGVTDGTYIMGVAAENIALNGFGLVQYNGTLKGINMSAFADGDVLWYDPTVAGGLTKTKPTAPNLKVQVAAVIHNGSGSSGSILIRINPGTVLGGTDSNVNFSALANGDLIQYDSALQYWKNIPVLNVANGGTGATTLTANALLKGNGTSTVSASNVSDNGSTVSIALTKGFSIARTAVTTPVAADGNVYSGTYTPTLTNTTNITSSTPVSCQYMRVGNVVTVSGRVDITATTVGSTHVLGISLPIASTFSSNAQCAGTAAYVSATVANNAVARLSGDTVNNRVVFQANATVNTSASWQFSFTYQIL